MLFSIGIIIISILYFVLLELSKNVIFGWVIAGLAIVLAFICRFKLKLNAIMIWAVFCGGLIANYLLSAPPFKTLPAVDYENPQVTEVVHVAQGDLTGVYNEDKSVKVYAGIPYAAAPVGDLRFKEPQPAEAWEGVRACDEFGPMAMQNHSHPMVDSLSHILGWHDYQFKFGDEFLEQMSEDCLYLNVWTPASESTELKPVIFYIHGGSLTTGQSSYSEYRGENLAKKDVVFVNFAYRLGVFGYYAAEDLKDESPNGTTGNYGLLDQIAALNWVRENIEAFGGDPNQITIAGESAGSSSVNALCVSPLTQGMFNYAIAESSGILAVEPFHTFRKYDLAIEEGDKVREQLGVTNSAELRDIPANQLLRTDTNQSAMTIDGYAIIEQPYLTYEKGNNHEKALLNGFNAKESDAFMLNTKVDADNYVDILAEAIGDEAGEMAQVVPANSPQRDQHFIVDAMGDAKGAANIAYSAIWFSYSHYLWNNYLIAQGVPTYEYYFTKTNNSLSNYHAGELPYAYGNLWRHTGLYEEDDFALSEIMQEYWANFAKTGNPNGNNLPEWKMRDEGQNQLLQLDTEIKMIDDPNEELYKVIDKYQNSLK
ncbi:carboxylesterase/lipase family protein [Pseudobutyrivibrio xylanivorans]|uniref:Carboxylic ester hydrolase n=1 Tax=Pseudobutyrivibrio xylanivorans TaxID=185007 RepID=A0A5P6VLM2_PSEXY|nr:carboxylesterase family protein [Pseudobutyrivibrio xylanivorans]QFJ53546.1 carboxylesterase family protein [Pseudobutyrivibrio xylanivorans]